MSTRRKREKEREGHRADLLTKLQDRVECLTPEIKTFAPTCVTDVNAGELSEPNENGADYEKPWEHNIDTEGTDFAFRLLHDGMREAMPSWKRERERKEAITRARRNAKPANWRALRGGRA